MGGRGGDGGGDVAGGGGVADRRTSLTYCGWMLTGVDKMREMSSSTAGCGTVRGMENFFGRTRRANMIVTKNVQTTDGKDVIEETP